MYAIINNGGKHYRVTTGTVVKVEKLAQNVNEIVEFPTLLVSNGEKVKVGSPILTNVTVKACILEHGLGDKIKIIKHRRRKHYIKHQGHRQKYTKVKITDIVVN